MSMAAIVCCCDTCSILLLLRSNFTYTSCAFKPADLKVDYPVTSWIVICLHSSYKYHDEICLFIPLLSCFISLLCWH